MPTIYVIHGPNEGDAYTISENDIIIGRGDECGITLNDEKTSREHVRVFFDASVGKHFAEDLKSTNGTWCKGQSIGSSFQLDHGMELELGNSTIEYSSRTFDSADQAKSARKSSSQQEGMPTMMEDSNRAF